MTGAPVDGSTPILTGGQAQVLTVATTYTGVSLQVILGLDNVTSFAVGNSIVRQGGALGFSATNPEGNIIGMGAWVPVNGISPTDLFIGQINRNKDVARLTGQRLAAAGRTYREGIQELAAIIHSFGGKPDTVLMNPIDWQKANIELQQGARYQEFTVGRSGFKALVIASPAGGDLRLMSDPNQDVGVVRVLTLSTWKLFHMGELIHTAMEDGLEIRKDAGTDSFAVLMRSWPQLVCFDPRANGVLTF